MGNHNEKEAIAEVLDTYRGIVTWKVAGLSRAEALRELVPSGTTLLGIVKHFAIEALFRPVGVERWWFQAVLGETEPDFPWTEDDPDADWRIETSESVQDVLDLYDQECAVSRSILEDLESLDADFAQGERTLIARDILLHVIEEIARHVGHMDILRELVDGSTGWGPQG